MFCHTDISAAFQKHFGSLREELEEVLYGNNVHQLSSDTKLIKLESYFKYVLNSLHTFEEKLNHWKQAQEELRRENKTLKIHIQELQLNYDAKACCVDDFKDKCITQFIQIDNLKRYIERIEGKLDLTAKRVRHLETSEKWFKEQLFNCRQEKNSLNHQLLSVINLIKQQMKTIEALRKELKDTEVHRTKNFKNLRDKATITNNEQRYFNFNRKKTQKIEIITIKQFRKLNINNAVLSKSLQELSNNFDGIIQLNEELKARCLTLQKSRKQNDTIIEAFETFKTKLCEKLVALTKKVNSKNDIILNLMKDSDVLTRKFSDLKQFCEGQKSITFKIDENLIRIKNYQRNLEADLCCKNNMIISLKNKLEDIIKNNLVERGFETDDVKELQNLLKSVNWSNLQRRRPNVLLNISFQSSKDFKAGKTISLLEQIQEPDEVYSEASEKNILRNCGDVQEVAQEYIKLAIIENSTEMSNSFVINPTIFFDGTMDSQISQNYNSFEMSRHGNINECVKRNEEWCALVTEVSASTATDKCGIPKRRKHTRFQKRIKSNPLKTSMLGKKYGEQKYLCPISKLDLLHGFHLELVNSPETSRILHENLNEPMKETTSGTLVSFYDNFSYNSIKFIHNDPMWNRIVMHKDILPKCKVKDYEYMFNRQCYGNVELELQHNYILPITSLRDKSQLLKETDVLRVQMILMYLRYEQIVTIVNKLKEDNLRLEKCLGKREAFLGKVISAFLLKMKNNDMENNDKIFLRRICTDLKSALNIYESQNKALRMIAETRNLCIMRINQEINSGQPTKYNRVFVRKLLKQQDIADCDLKESLNDIQGYIGIIREQMSALQHNVINIL